MYYGGLPSNYDDWKTACCGRYPNCKDCPCDYEYEEEIDYEEQELDEKAEDAYYESLGAFKN